MPLPPSCGQPFQHAYHSTTLDSRHDRLEHATHDEEADKCVSTAATIVLKGHPDMKWT
jgi:hypothetical protein